MLVQDTIISISIDQYFNHIFLIITLRVEETWSFQGGMQVKLQAKVPTDIPWLVWSFLWSSIFLIKRFHFVFYLLSPFPFWNIFLRKCLGFITWPKTEKQTAIYAHEFWPSRLTGWFMSFMKAWAKSLGLCLLKVNGCYWRY